MLAGILPPLVTPFREDGGAGPRRPSRPTSSRTPRTTWAGTSSSGRNGEAAVAGGGGEARARSRSARRHAGSRLLLAGTGLESTRATIALTRKAADAGADAALVLTPSLLQGADADEVLPPPLRGGGGGLAHAGPALFGACLYRPSLSARPWPRLWPAIPASRA